MPEVASSIHSAKNRSDRARCKNVWSCATDTLTSIYKNKPRGIIALVFRCKITGGQLTTNTEVAAFRWADQDDTRQLTTTEAYAMRFLDALRQDAAPAIRQHDGTYLIE